MIVDVDHPIGTLGQRLNRCGSPVPALIAGEPWNAKTRLRTGSARRGALHHRWRSLGSLREVPPQSVTCLRHPPVTSLEWRLRGQVLTFSLVAASGVIMARPLRIELENGLYHGMARRWGRRDVVRDDVDRESSSFLNAWPFDADDAYSRGS